MLEDVTQWERPFTPNQVDFRAFYLNQVVKLTLTQVVMLKKVVTKFREKVGNL